MEVKKYIKKYKDYETKELARRAAKRKKVSQYKSLAKKRIPVKKAENVKITARNITRAIDNPYGVKFPKAKKTLKKVKGKKRRRAKKVIVVYR